AGVAGAGALAERVLAFGHGATQLRTPNPFRANECGRPGDPGAASAVRALTPRDGDQAARRGRGDAAGSTGRAVRAHTPRWRPVSQRENPTRSAAFTLVKSVVSRTSFSRGPRPRACAPIHARP